MEPDGDRRQNCEPENGCNVQVVGLATPLAQGQSGEGEGGEQCRHADPRPRTGSRVERPPPPPSTRALLPWVRAQEADSAPAQGFSVQQATNHISFIRPHR